MICGSGGSKSRLAKAAGAEPAGQMRDDKLHAVVARSTFRSQNVQNTSASDHFWKLRCQKSARRCGAKHISKSKCTKHFSVGPLLEVAMSKKRMPLWCEAHFQVKMYKALQPRTAFGSWDVEKVHAVVARSTFPSQNVQSTSASDHFWTLRCRKSARRCGAKHGSRSKCIKHTSFGALLKLRCRKSAAVVARSTFRSENVQNTTCFAPLFGGADVVLRGRRKGLCTLSKVSKTWGFCSISRSDGRRGAFEEDLQRCISRGRCSIQKTCSSEMFGGQGADFLRGVAFWSIRSSGLLRWFCVTGAALRMTWNQFFLAGAVLYTGGVEKSQNALARGSQRCTQLSIFEGSLAELLCFWRC